MRGFVFTLVLICNLLFNTASAQPARGWTFAHSNDKYYLDFDSQRISRQGKNWGLDSIYNDNIQYNTFTLGNKSFSYMYFDSSGKPYILD